MRFDFGSNYAGGNSEYRGSYLCYLRYADDDGKILMSSNLPLDYVRDVDGLAAEYGAGLPEGRS